MKRKFVGGIFSLCLILSVVGCGNGSEERQTSNSNQSETELVREDAGESAHELYEGTEEAPGITEGSHEGRVEPLPELVNSEWWERKVQIYDMVFTNDRHLTEEDIRKIVEGSAYDVELTERLYDGNVYLDLKVNGIVSACFHKLNSQWIDELRQYGLIADGDYHSINYGDYTGLLELPYRVWYDKARIEFEDLETRDDVLAYLAENGFVEVESTQSPYYNRSGGNIYPDITSVELADIPHYYSESEEYITFYRIHKLSETDQEVERRDTFPWVLYSGAHLNLVNVVKFSFNANGYICNRPYKLELYSYTIMGERTGEKFDIHP